MEQNYKILGSDEKELKWFSRKKICIRLFSLALSLLIFVSSMPLQKSYAAFNRGTHSNTHIFHIAKDNGDILDINKWIRVTDISVSGQKVTWVVEYNPTEQVSGFPFHNFGLGQDIVESTLRIQREQWKNGAYQPERNLTGSDYGTYPNEIEKRTKYIASVKAPLRVDFKDLYEQNRTTSDQQSGNPVGNANLAELQRFHAIDTGLTPRIGYWYKSNMAKGKYRYTISVDIRQGVNPYSVPFVAMFDANMNSRRWVVAYTDLGDQPTSAVNKRDIYLFKNTLIKTVGSNNQPNGVDRAKMADIIDNDGIASVRVIAENGNEASLGYSVDANGAYGTPSVDKGLYSRGLRVTDSKGVTTDFFRAADNMYKTYIADVTVNGEITKDPGGALTADQQNALRTEILNKVTIDGGTSQNAINNKYRKVIIGDLPTSGWGNRVTVRVISESNVYKDVQVVVNFKELPTIGQYDISWDNASVTGRNDIGFSWENNNKALVYKYNVDDATNFNVNDVLKQLRATAKSNVDATRFDKRALDGNEKEYVERTQNNFSNYTERGPARLNGSKNVNYLDIVNPANLWGGRPVINPSEINATNRDFNSLYQGVNGPISSSVSVPQANGVSAFNITGNGLLANTLAKQKVYIGTAPAITRGGTTANDTDGVGDTIPLYLVGYIPNQAPSIAKKDIVIWKTNNSTIKTGLTDTIQDQEIPITDPDNPMTFNASNISVVADGTNNRILPNISFKIQNGKVYMTGYADEHTRHTANFKVTDGPHNVTGPDIWLFVAEANGGEIIKNIGEQVTRDEVLNKVVVSPLGDLDTSKITKDLYTNETLPAVNENKTVFVKVTYTDTEKANVQYKVVPVNILYNVIDRTNNTSAPTPSGYVRITLNADAVKGRLTVGGENVQTKVYDVKVGTERSVIDNLVTLSPNTNWRVVEAKKWSDNANADIPQTINATENNKTYTAQFEEIDKELYYSSNVEDIYLWKISENPDTSSDIYRQMESIRGYILPIKDRDTPATFTEAYFGWNDEIAQEVGRDTNNLISFDNNRNIVHLSGHTNANVGAYTRKIVVKDPYHTLKSNAIKVYISDASANPINKNIGETTTEEEIKNAVTFNHPSGASTALNNVVKTVVYKPDNLNVGSYVAKVKVTNFKGVSKVVDVPVNYNIIDRGTSTTEQTPNGYVRITLNAEANKGQLRVGSTNVATKVYDVKAGTNRSVIDNLVTITPNNNYQVANQKWKDSNSQDIPQVINNSGSYTAQFEQKLYVNTNNGNLEDIFVWKINENPDASSDRYRQMESVSTYTLPIKDKTTPATFRNVYFKNHNSDTLSNVGHLAVTFDNSQNVVKLSGYADTVPGMHTRKITAIDTVGNRLDTANFKVVVYDATVTPINKNIGEVTTEDDIKNAVNINYGDYPNNEGTRANREVTKEIIAETKPANLSEGSYVVKVKLTNIKGMVKVVDVPVNYNIIDRGTNATTSTPQGYVRITLQAETEKGQLTVNGQNAQTRIYDVKTNTPRTDLERLFTLTPNSNWRVVETQKWKDDANADIPTNITATKTYTAQFEKINNELYIDAPNSNLEDIYLWKLNENPDASNDTYRRMESIAGYVLPIKDRDNPANFTEIYFAGSNGAKANPTNLSIVFDNNTNTVKLSGYTDANVGMMTRKVVAKDGVHTLESNNIKIQVFDATVTPILKNIGQNTTEDDIKNAVAINKGTGLTQNAEVVNKEVILKPDNLNEGSYVAKVKLTNFKNMVKVVDVPVNYNVIDRGTSTTEQTPNGYVRITLQADNTKGKLVINNQDTQTRIYDVKEGTARSVIDNLVTLTPNANWRVVETQKWKDDANADIPQTITTAQNGKTYNAQFEEINKSPRLTQTKLEDIFVWEITTDPDSSTDKYRKMESVANYPALAIADVETPATFTNAYFERSVGVKENVGHLSIVANRENNTIKIAGYADVAQAYHRREIVVEDAPHTFRSPAIWVVVFDATVTPINKNIGEVTTEDDIKNAVDIEYGNYPDNEETRANRVVRKEIIEETKPANLSEGSYVVKVKLTNVKGMVKVVDVPVNYNIIDRGTNVTTPTPQGYVRITLQADNAKGQLTVNNQDVSTKVYDLKENTPKSVIENLVTIKPNDNWRVATQKWRDNTGSDIPDTITTAQNGKTYNAQFEEIDKQPYYDKGNNDSGHISEFTKTIVLWKGQNVQKELPIKDKNEASIDRDSVYFVNKNSDTREDIAGLSLTVNETTEDNIKVQTIQLNGKVDEKTSLERRIRVQDAKHNAIHTGTLKVVVIDAEPRTITVPFGEFPTEEAVRNATGITGTENLTSEESAMTYNFDANTISNYGDVFGIQVEITNSFGETKTVVVPIEYEYKKATITAKRPLRGDRTVEVEGEFIGNDREGRKAKLTLNKGREVAPIEELFVNGKAIFTLNNPLKKGDKIVIELVLEVGDIGTPPLRFTIR